ncbi:hypothetical protein P7C70_g9055, partial [Phenoliferia sp. Uapishka_3]
LVVIALPFLNLLFGKNMNRHNEEETTEPCDDNSDGAVASSLGSKHPRVEDSDNDRGAGSSLKAILYPPQGEKGASRERSLTVAASIAGRPFNNFQVLAAHADNNINKEKLLTNLKVEVESTDGSLSALQLISQILELKKQHAQELDRKVTAFKLECHGYLAQINQPEQGHLFQVQVNKNHSDETTLRAVFKAITVKEEKSCVTSRKPSRKPKLGQRGRSSVFPLPKLPRGLVASQGQGRLGIWGFHLNSRVRGGVPKHFILRSRCKVGEKGKGKEKEKDEEGEGLVDPREVRWKNQKRKKQKSGEMEEPKRIFGSESTFVKLVKEIGPSELELGVHPTKGKKEKRKEAGKEKYKPLELASIEESEPERGAVFTELTGPPFLSTSGLSPNTRTPAIPPARELKKGPRAGAQTKSRLLNLNSPPALTPAPAPALQAQKFLSKTEAMNRAFKLKPPVPRIKPRTAPAPAAVPRAKPLPSPVFSAPRVHLQSQLRPPSSKQLAPSSPSSSPSPSPTSSRSPSPLSSS